MPATEHGAGESAPESPGIKQPLMRTRFLCHGNTSGNPTRNNTSCLAATELFSVLGISSWRRGIREIQQPWEGEFHHQWPKGPRTPCPGTAYSTAQQLCILENLSFSQSDIFPSVTSLLATLTGALRVKN